MPLIQMRGVKSASITDPMIDGLSDIAILLAWLWQPGAASKDAPGIWPDEEIDK
jgi:hypothetical protein